MAAPRLSDPNAYVVQIRRPDCDTWHSYPTLEEAAAYALDLMRVVFDGKTYPNVIWHNEQKVCKLYGNSGKLHFPSTPDATTSNQHFRTAVTRAREVPRLVPMLQQKLYAHLRAVDGII